MTGSIRSNPSNQTPRLPPTEQQSGTVRTAPGTPAAVEREPTLAPAPRHPAGQTRAGSSHAPRGAAPTRLGTAASGPALRSAGPTPSMALTTLAKDLAKLEQERQELSSQLSTAKAKRLIDANQAASKPNGANLRKLQDHMTRAATDLRNKTAERDAKLDRLERAEQQVASCERSLKALNLDDAPREAPAAETEARASRPALQAYTPPQALNVPARVYDPAETALRDRIRDLNNELDLLKTAKARATQTISEARREAERLQEDAKAILTPERFVPAVDIAARQAINNFLRGVKLPPDAEKLPAVDVVAKEGNDDRFSRYLEHFTEAPDGGGVHLKAAFQDSVNSSLAFGALFSAGRPNSLMPGVVQTVVRDHGSQFAQAMRSGREALLPLVRPRVVDALDKMATLMQGMHTATQQQFAGSRRGKLDTGEAISRAQAVSIGANSGVLAQLLADSEQREEIVNGLVSHVEFVLESVVESHEIALEKADAAQARYKQVMVEQRPVFQRALDAPSELGKARDEVNLLTKKREQREAAEAKEAAGPARSAAVPDTELASSTGADAEARQLKLRGDVLKHTDTAEGLRQSIAKAEESIDVARDALRAAEEKLDAAAARHAGNIESARRKRGQQGDEISSLRTRLAALDAHIERARVALKADPSRKATISDRAWDRAVERHVEPDDESLRARARITGYSGAYRSHAELARSAADIHTHVSQQPQFKAVMAATSREGFERAAAAVPGGVIDLVHEHGREVGRGFSNDPDQTDRPTSLTQSNFSLQFEEGRVVVTHIYPYVPHRELTTLP